MPFIIIKDNAGELLLNTDQIVHVYKNPGTDHYAGHMRGGGSPTDLNAQQYAALKTLVDAKEFPKNPATQMSNRMDQVK